MKKVPDKKAAPKKVTPKKVAAKKVAPKKTKTKRVVKTIDPRMVDVQYRQKQLADEETLINSLIKKEQKAIKLANAKCMSNAKNLNKHVHAIKGGIAEYSKALKGADNSNAIDAATEKLINKIQLCINAVGVVRDLKFDVLKLVDKPEDDDFGDL